MVDVKDSLLPELGNKTALIKYEDVNNCMDGTVMNISSILNENDESLVIEGKLDGRPAKMLIDSGAKGNFIADKLVRYLHLRTMKCVPAKRIRVADGRIINASKEVEDIEIRFNDTKYRSKESFYDYTNGI